MFKKSQIKYIIFSFLTVSIFTLFTNTTSYNINTPESFVFGPSLSSQDGRSIFNITPENTNFWQKMRQRMNAVTLNSLHLDDKAHFNNVNFARNYIALTDAHLNSLNTYLNANEMEMIVEVGQGLNRVTTVAGLATDPCRLFLGGYFHPSHIEKGVIAEMNLLNRLINKGIIISELSFDGPLLRLIAGSRKELTCGARGLGYTTEQTTLVVMHYIKMLKTRVELAQNRPVKINLVVNLPNWQFDTVPAVFPDWWQENNVNFREVFRNFIHTMNNAPNCRFPIHSIIIDFPYNFTESAIHRADFQRKISLMAELMKETNQIRNSNNVVIGQYAPAPHLAIIANTSGEFIAPELRACISQNNMPYLTPFASLPSCRASSVELASIYSQHRASDCQYRAKSEYYLNMIRSGLPSNVRLQRIFLESWHMSPRFNSEYGSWGVDYINKLFF